MYVSIKIFKKYSMYLAITPEIQYIHRLKMSHVPFYFDWRQIRFPPLNLFTIVIISLLSILALIGTLLFIFQNKLIYLPQFPPGSLSEVWLPSRFGYGPGKPNRKLKAKSEDNNKTSKLSLSKKFDDHPCDEDDYDCNSSKLNEDDDVFKWEELELITKDNVKLQAFWIKAPSTWKSESEKEKEKEKESSSSNSLRERLVVDDIDKAPFTIIYMQANAGNIVQP